MSLVRRAGAIRKIKMVADRDSDEVLGVSMVGNSAGEVIHEAAIGLRFPATKTPHGFRAAQTRFLSVAGLCQGRAQSTQMLIIEMTSTPRPSVPNCVVTMLPSSRRQFTVMVNSNFASSSIWPAKHRMATTINKPPGFTGLFKSWTRLALGAMAGTPGRS